VPPIRFSFTQDQCQSYKTAHKSRGCDEMAILLVFFPVLTHNNDASADEMAQLIKRPA
jgi:hypothetical protein